MKPPIVATATIRPIKAKLTRSAPGVVISVPLSMIGLVSRLASQIPDLRYRQAGNVDLECEQISRLRLGQQRGLVQPFSSAGDIGGLEIGPAKGELGDVRGRQMDGFEQGAVRSVAAHPPAAIEAGPDTALDIDHRAVGPAGAFFDGDE